MEDAKWTVMVRQWPGSYPVRCRNLKDEFIALDTEEAAQALARKYRDSLSPHGFCQPHYYAAEV